MVQGRDARRTATPKASVYAWSVGPVLSGHRSRKGPLSISTAGSGSMPAKISPGSRAEPSLFRNA